MKAQEKEIAAIRLLIGKLLRSHPSLGAKCELLRGIPGLGKTIVQIVLGELPDLRGFSDARQLAGWVGLTSSHLKGGTLGRTRTPITKIDPST
ncbi:transposase [Akkermansiaceae bacterium]|nr:transposase [Akkermansiaceae bacterium]